MERVGPFEVVNRTVVAGGEPRCHRTWPGAEVAANGDLVVAHKGLPPTATSWWPIKKGGSTHHRVDDEVVFVARSTDGSRTWPDTISTDAHHGVVDPPLSADMPNVMSKFLHLGMPLVDGIRASTISPAQTIGWHDRIGTLEVGLTADVAILSLEEGEFPLSDSSKQPETATRCLIARHTSYAGRLLDRKDG